MKTAGMTLGIIGGTISILFGLFLVLGGVTFMDDGLWQDAYDTMDGYNGASIPAVTEQMPILKNTVPAMSFVSMSSASDKNAENPPELPQQ